MKITHLLFLLILGLVSTPASSWSAPTFESIAKKYSVAKAPDGFKKFCAKNGNPNPNTCAVRLASALNSAEAAFFTGQKPRSGIIWEGLPTRASDLAIILNARLGKATTVKDGNTPLDLKLLSGKKGIIFFDTIKDFDGTGHISLWNGAEVVDKGDYLKTSPRVYFWPLK